MFEHLGTATISKISLVKTKILKMIPNPVYEDTSSHAQTNQNTSFAEFLFHTVANQSHVQKMADVSCSHDTKNNYENYSPKPLD